MMQTEVSLIHYVGVPIYSNESLNSMFGFASINWDEYPIAVLE
jgi:hypothetical protein